VLNKIYFFFCKDCNFSTITKRNYTRHLQTQKHKMNSDYNKKSEQVNEVKTEIHLIKNLLVENMGQNHTTINNITNVQNVQNNNFNLNFFLNEKCKDAMNIEDFINTLELCPFDVAETGRLGYVEGISRIFMNKLNQLDIYNRPLHCTDLKRETLYIKEDNKWEKDNEQKDKLQSIVEQIANKNYEQLPIWQQQNPNHLVANSTECELFMDIACNILGGGNEQESSKFRNRIMRNVMKEVTVSKHLM
jgi:abortive infection bacteriophage resistance protein